MYGARFQLRLRRSRSDRWGHADAGDVFWWWRSVNREFSRLSSSGLQSAFPPCPGGEIGRRKGLEKLSTRLGNGRREWGQIRGTSLTRARGARACNPELSLKSRARREFPGKCRDLTAPV